ncbi:hypothetical protein NT05LM_1890, partial [Listeria marthii FSL S4-120]
MNGILLFNICSCLFDSTWAFLADDVACTGSSFP